MNDNLISIIIQGPYIDSSGFNAFSTNDVLKSARDIYPSSEIIYSGWEGVKLPKEFIKGCDKIVLSKDPGPLIIGNHNDNPVYENTNRQIISTLNGLLSSTKDTCIKSRSDTLFVNKMSLKLHENNPNNLFSSPIIISETFTRFHFFEYGGFKQSFGHLSDLIHIGKKKDLLKYWSGPLIKPMKLIFQDLKTRPTAEQLLFLRFLINNELFNVNNQISSKFQSSLETLDFKNYKKFIANNFMTKNESELGISLPHRFKRTSFEKRVFINQLILDEIKTNNIIQRKAIIRNIITFMIFCGKNVIIKLFGRNKYKVLYNKLREKSRH
jgi:hypothetical protein